MNDEVNPNDAQVGLYRDPESGQFIGALHEAQASAAMRAGFKLFEAGDEAAKRSEKDLEQYKNPPEHDVDDKPKEGGQTYTPKKGK